MHATRKLIVYNAGATKKLFFGFDFEAKLTELLQKLLKSNEFSSTHWEHFIASVKSHEEFKIAAKKIHSEISIPLIKLFSSKEQQLAELLQIFSIDESQISENDEDLCCSLLETEQFMHSQILMTKLSMQSRTQFVISCLKGKNPQKILLLLDSGKIDPTMINLSTISDKLLYHKEVVTTLLDLQVNPCGLMDSKKLSDSPLKRLAGRCPHKFDKQSKRLKHEMVQTMKLLIDAGANVEDLNNYHRGNSTTPLHVATELAIVTSESITYKTYGKFCY